MPGWSGLGRGGLRAGCWERPVLQKSEATSGPGGRSRRVKDQVPVRPRSVAEV